MIGEMAKLPTHKIDMLVERVSVEKADSPLIISEGKRNDFLCSIAGYMRFRGLSSYQVNTVLGAVNECALEPPESRKRIQQISYGSANWETQVDKYIEVLSDIEEAPMEYVIPNYIPARAVTTLEGDPAVGKSSLLGEIAASVTTGKDFCGIKPSRTGNILFFAIEDDPASVFKVRARLQGADQSKILYAKEPLSLDDSGIEVMHQAIAQKRYELIVVDTLTASIGHLNMNDGAEMASLLRKLSNIASMYDTSIVVVRHLRKGGSENPHYAGSGSVAITGAVRSAMMVKLSPDNPSQRYLAHSKSNGPKRSSTLIFSIEGVVGEEIGRLVWEGTSSLTAEDVATLKLPSGSESAKAESFLREYLARGPRKAKDVLDEAKRRDISERTLNRVKADLGVTSSGGPNSKWEMPKK